MRRYRPSQAVLAVAEVGQSTRWVAVVGFLGRDQGRKAHLKIGDIELTIDQATKAETSKMIDIVRDAIERSR